MEAPEKIYVTEGMIFMTNPEITLSGDNKIEYIRKDAFIENACKFLFENYHGEKLSLRMINDFKNYIKEE